MANSRVTLTVNDLWSLIIVEDNVGEVRMSVKDDTHLEETVDIDSGAMLCLKKWINYNVGRGSGNDGG